MEDDTETCTDIAGFREEKYKRLMSSGLVLYLMCREVHASCKVSVSRHIADCDLELRVAIYTV